MISAPWVEADKKAALRLVSAKVRELLAPTELLAISRIVPVEPTSPEVEAINLAFPVEHSMVEVRDDHFFGLAIKRAHIFASGGGVTASARLPADKALPRPRRKTASR